MVSIFRKELWIWMEHFCVQLPACYTLMGGMSTAKPGMQVSKLSWQRTAETAMSVEDALWQHIGPAITRYQCLFFSILFFSQKASEVVGQLTAEFPERRRINSITLQRHDGREKNKRPIQSCCSSVQEEPDLNKAPLSKLPFLKYKVLTSCMVHFVVSLNFLEPCWEWGNPQIWCQDRNTSGLLHYSC